MAAMTDGHSKKPGTGRGAAAALLLLLLAAAGAGCGEPKALTCPTGIYCPAGTKCAARQAVCIVDNCGDGVLQAGEVCDDGNKIDGDSCSADCKSNETCGNGIIDVAMGEVCDDGNNVDGDGCSADCKSIEGCGNGVVDLGEDCDSGPSGTPHVALETRGCNANCKWPRCGDGVVNKAAGEQCDRNGDGVAGANGESTTCNANCTESVCGDGVKNVLAGEKCDDGAANSLTGDCLPGSCQPNVCGDGYVNETLDVSGNLKEECDDGAAKNSYSGACLPTCRKAQCGDGHVQTGVETCDTGSDSATTKTACPYGQKNCTLCSACQLVPFTGKYCGDGPPTDPEESCDDGANNGATSCDYGLQTCRICSANCSQYIARTGPFCGDSIKNGTEACDDGNRVTEIACSYGQTSCTMCSADCGKVLTGPSYTGDPNGLKIGYCGNGVLDANFPLQTQDETCDDTKSFNCGTCDAATCTYLQRGPATGTITVTSVAFVDGDSFTLDDGAVSSLPVTFELNRGSCQLGHVCIDLSTATLETAAGLIAGAIHGVTSLSIDAAPDGNPPSTTRLKLTNQSSGITGNNPIETSGASVVVAPATGAVVVQGMAGGAGCPLSSPCNENRDCLSTHCGSTSHVCKP